MDAADRPERDHGGMPCAARLPLSAARSRHQVHSVLPSDYRVRPGRAARIATPQPEPECLCGALGEVGEGGVPVQGDPLWRALAVASAERICRTFSCRTESPREGQCLAVPSEREHPPRCAVMVSKHRVKNERRSPVLLSFAQFEREVTSERIRDKIAASKRKGLWVGGMAPLGYDTKDRKITVNGAEADRVGTIFRSYLRLRPRLVGVEL